MASLLAIKEKERKDARAEHETLLAAVEAAGEMSEENRTRLDELQATLTALDTDIATLTSARNVVRNAPAAEAEVEGPVTPVGAIKPLIRRVSDQFLASTEWQGYMKAVAPHGFSQKARVDGPTIEVNGSILPVRRQALITEGSTSAGALIIPDQTGIFDEGTAMRPLSILDVLTRGTTESDSIEYVKVTGFTNNAAGVAEADSVDDADDTGRKPWSSLALLRVNEPVKTIAHGEAATTRALSDAGQMRTILDTFLRYGLLEQVEDDIISGAGGNTFSGILTVSNTQDQAFDTDLLTTARKAKTKVRVGGRARANAYLMHPNDWEAFDLELTLGGTQVNRIAAEESTPRLWGLPVVESEAVPEGTAIVADFTKAVFYDRQQTTVQATSGYMDFFMKNLVAVLAEMRAAFAVIRPEAFVVIDLSAGS